MKYRFWGWEHADAKAITAEYKGIETPVDLYDALSHVWCADTCAPRMRDRWTKDNMTLGQCSITAFLAQDIFGGKVYGIKRPGGNYHCYNVIGDCAFDLTSEQFGDEGKLRMPRRGAERKVRDRDHEAVVAGAEAREQQAAALHSPG